jgi:hypothetical protein
MELWTDILISTKRGKEGGGGKRKGGKSNFNKILPEYLEKTRDLP